MKNLKSLLVLTGGMAMFWMACSKGDTGPQGPAGPAGPDSVIHSAWVVLNMTRQVPQPNDTIYTQTLTAPAITQRILDSGVVLTYLSLIDNNNVTNVVNASVYFYSEIFTPGSIDLTSLVDYSGLNYRYVVIPGSTTAGTITSGPAKGLTKAELQTMSYAAVQKLIGETPGQVGGQ